MRERGEAEGKAYMEKLFAKWKAYREGIATRWEAIHDKMDDKSHTNWAKSDADLKKRKADILKAYEEKRMADRKADQERRETYEKMMAEWKADQERRETYEKMMAEWKADQERWEAERKAYEEKRMADRKADQERRETYKKMMAKWKADQERRETYEKMMAEWKADQERWEAERNAYEEKRMAEQRADQEKREAERKAHQNDLQKIMKEMIDANQTKIDDNQEELDIDLKEMREEIKSGEAEMKFTVDAFQEKMDVLIANRKDDRKETSCQETTEAHLECEKQTSVDMESEEVAIHSLKECRSEKAASQKVTETEADPGKMQSVEEHQEIPKEEAALMPVGGLRKRRRDRNLAAGCHQKPKRRIRASCESRRLTITGKKMTRRATVARRKRNVLRRIGTQGNCEPHKEFATARIRTTRCAKVARGREHGLQRQGKDVIAPRTRKGRKEEGEGLWNCLERNSVIRN
jgi:hypothetical protein